MGDIDHLVYFVPDLESAIASATTEYGAAPVFGGQHPGRGTHNALLALGDSYLELIAPDPDQTEPAGPRPFGLDDLTESQFVTFAVRPSDGETIDQLIAALADVGLDPGPAMAMSRATPSGDELRWRLTTPDLRHGGSVPFLIDWGDTPKPHTTAPAGPRLAGLTVGGHDVALTTAAMEALGLADRVTVRQGGPTVIPHFSD